MASISFRGAYLRHLTMRHDEASNSTYAILAMGADYSDTVCEKMGWPTELPEAFRMPAKLKGELRDCDGLVMTPNGAELKKHEMQISLDTVGGFSLVGMKGEDDDERSELRFEIRTNQKDAAAWVEKYFRSIGKGVGVLRVKYGHLGQGELEETPEEPEGEESQQSLPDVRDMGVKVRGGRRAVAATEGD